MNRKIILLNVVLLALVVWLGLQLRANWQESQLKERAVFDRQAKAVPVTAPPALPGAAAVSAVDYLNVAQQTLFAEDRSPTVIIDTPAPPPPPPPDPPTPPFPQYHGQMSFGEPVIVLSMGENKQKSYRVGDQVGEFKIAAFDRESVTLEWSNKTFKPLLKELTPKEAPKAPPPVADNRGQPSAPPPVSALAPKGKLDGQPGPQSGMYRECQLGDNSPNGTVKDGYRKTISQTLMGESCHWEPIH